MDANALRHEPPAAVPTFILHYSLPSLPDVAGVLRHHRLSRLAAEGFLELRHILHNPVHAELAGRVRIGVDLKAQIFRPLLFTPHASEAEEEALLGREAVDALTFF